MRACFDLGSELVTAEAAVHGEAFRPVQSLSRRNFDLVIWTVGEAKCTLFRRLLRHHHPLKECGSYQDFDGLVLRRHSGLRGRVDERLLRFLCRLSLLLHGRTRLDLRHRGFRGERDVCCPRGLVCLWCCHQQMWTGLVWTSLIQKKSYGGVEMASDGLLPSSGALGWDLRCRLAEGRLTSRYLSGKHLMLPTPTVLGEQ